MATDVCCYCDGSHNSEVCRAAKIVEKGKEVFLGEELYDPTFTYSKESLFVFEGEFATWRRTPRRQLDRRKQLSKEELLRILPRIEAAKRRSEMELEVANEAISFCQ